LLKSGPAKRVTIYLGEDQQYHGQALYNALLEFLFFHGISGATVTRGIAGFGAHHHLHTTRVLSLAENLPVKVEFLESAEKVEEITPKLFRMVSSGVVEIQDTTVIVPDRTPKTEILKKAVPVHRMEGAARLMRIYVGENDKWRDKPLHQALVEALRANDIAGVTVYRGILGYGANRRIHQDKSLAFSHDRPIMLSVVDTDEKLRAFIPVLEEMVRQGLVVVSNVEVIKYSHNYALVERRRKPRT
jgi:PII-like signaling protein